MNDYRRLMCLHDTASLTIGSENASCQIGSSPVGSYATAGTPPAVGVAPNIAGVPHLTAVISPQERTLKNVQTPCSKHNPFARFPESSMEKTPRIPKIQWLCSSPQLQWLRSSSSATKLGLKGTISTTVARVERWNLVVFVSPIGV